MGRIFYIWYGFFLVGLIALFAIWRVNEGRVLMMSFEGDAVHMAQVTLRMMAGEVPSVDFQTPLGAMAFLPITLLMWVGYNLGPAFGYAPVLLALISLPAVYWVGNSRFSGMGAMGFGAAFLTMLLGYLHGGLSPTVTAAMYYNNWCWAVSMLLVALVVIPHAGSFRARLFEAVILGVGMGFLTLTKATYVVFLLPAIVTALVMQKNWLLLAGGIVVSLVFLLVVTLPLGGVAYWVAYIGDLLDVAGSPLRARPSAGVATQLIAPTHIAASLLILSAVVFLRQARRQQDGLVVLLLAAGWVLITYQNWQSDPHWVVIAGLILFPLSRDIGLYNQYGWHLKSTIRFVAVGLLVLGAPLTYAQVLSVLVHHSADPARFETGFKPALQSRLAFQDQSKIASKVEIDHPYLAETGIGGTPAMLGDEALPDCRSTNGLTASLKAMGAAIDAIDGTAGKTALLADWGNGLWLFSNLEPLPGGAPWYYGGTPGFENADLLVVPMCPMLLQNRKLVLDEINKDPALNFHEVARNKLFILLEKSP